jgi:hypothetical protein
MKTLWSAATAVALLIAAHLPAEAGLTIIGNGVNGDVAVASGTSVWSLVSGVQTPVAPGYNSHNAILHNYLVATGAAGEVSIFSLGELNPSFGGTNLAPYIGVSGGAYALIDPNAGASGRDVSDLVSLRVIAIAALPNGAGGPSSSLTLSGAVAAPGAYDLAALNALPKATTTVSGVTYSGPSVSNFLKPNLTNVTSGIVVVTASDGYEVVFSAAELDPALGGNPNALFATAASSNDFPASALARIVTPGDNKHGRWVSNIDSVTVSVAAAPEPASWALMLAGLLGLGAIGRRRAGTMAAIHA